ncbi:hypothetical protein O3W44_08655 [Pantoea sp. LMR881]|uniref:hypothetical protein n=1 Tax=Pantoea sp. LMR881 TaxID=3014336 RepID=UPI0022AF0671|nr:hypothetical protein [Pantoea sp. LMR881]MCZ4059132.1 hypothetical protein [Pantoea sp. LMR881]
MWLLRKQQHLTPKTASPEEQSVPYQDKNAGSVFEPHLALARQRVNLTDEANSGTGRASWMTHCVFAIGRTGFDHFFAVSDSLTQRK